MTVLNAFLSIMLVVVGLFFVGAFVMKDIIAYVFSHNIFINGLILSSFFIGIFVSFTNMMRAKREYTWFNLYIRNQEDSTNFEPSILSALSITKRERFNLFELRNILSSIEARLDNRREVPRYIMGILIFLGLLGTFWGLSKTVGAIAGLINGINLSADDVASVIASLKKGLESPLGGMGTAFGCSLFGLTGSLVLGCLDILTSKAFTRFYQTIEERLALLRDERSTHELSSAASSHHPAPSVLQSAMLGQLIEALTNLEGKIRRSEDNKQQLTRVCQTFTEKLSELNDCMISHQTIVKKMAQNQIDIQEQMHRIVSTSFNDNANPITYLRSLDASTNQLLAETIEGRKEMLYELKNEIRLVTKTLAALSEQEAA